MMRTTMLLLCAFALPLAACGHKGKLKAPAQVEAEEQKKQAKAAKKARKEAKAKAKKEAKAKQGQE